jgi:hypothetical protein
MRLKILAVTVGLVAAAAFPSAAYASYTTFTADPDAPACSNDGFSGGGTATYHNVNAGDWGGANYFWSADPCWDYWLWTYGNGTNASGDTVTWSAPVGTNRTCDIVVEIPSGNPGTSGYKFNTSAHYTVYSGGTRLGDAHLNQATAGTWLGASLDLGNWRSNGSGSLSVVLDDSSPLVRSGQPLYRVVAGGLVFGCN